jgi:membrane-bound lytic murein transglycosylase D
MVLPIFRRNLPGALLAGLLVVAGLAMPGLAAADDGAQPARLAGPDAGGPDRSAPAAEAEPADGDASIISIDSAPDTVEPLLKAIDDQGDPQRDLWARIRAGFALPELDTPLVAENESWYADRPEYVARMLQRGKRYLYYIVEEVEKRGMPTEIALLPMIESAFNPQAHSRSNAVGIWQFIPSTGRTFGLQQNWWVDSRRDIMAATNAALDYLQKLHDMFGDWELALAAYNWGEGSVSRAIARNEAQGLPTDYLNLRMPAETANYVPRLLAVKHLVQRPQDFSAELGVLPNAPYFAQITVNQHIDVALAARLAEISLKEFTALNPHYNRPIISAKQPATLLLPVDKAEVFAHNLENHTTPLVSWKPYPAKRGERLDLIAHHHGISIARLKEANGLPQGARRLAHAQMLLVPGVASEQTFDRTRFTAAAATADAPGAGSYVVRRGDTLDSIARKHGVTAAQIRLWNGLKSARLALNQKLVIARPAATRLAMSTRPAPARAAAAKKPKQTHYVVRRSDTLYGIAQRFDVELDDLRRWNKLSARSRLHPGDKLTLYLAKAN